MTAEKSPIVCLSTPTLGQSFGSEKIIPWYFHRMKSQTKHENDSRLINREFSQLEFNRRVLAMAQNPNVPLLERLRFLCIASSILDEFFEIRVAGLVQQQNLGSSQRGPDGLTASEQMTYISEVSRDLIDKIYKTLNRELLPKLAKQEIRILEQSDWNKKQRSWLKKFFIKEVVPLTTAMGLDPSRPFPEPLNKGLAFIVDLEGTDAFGRAGNKAIVQAPRSLPRVIKVPVTDGSGLYDFVLLSSIIEAFVGELFLGMRAERCFQFRVTRSSDLFVDEEAIDDLRSALEVELSNRHLGTAVRLEVAKNCPEELTDFLAAQFRLDRSNIFSCDGPVNLARLSSIPDQVDIGGLKYPMVKHAALPELSRKSNLFKILREQDILLHHPFQPFDPFILFLRQAAADPKVLAIRQTLYRAGVDSPVVDALLRAAKAGKEVLAVIELRARFDEQANIELANRLQESGAQVVYGVAGHKTHAKMCLVLRREKKRLARYIHLGTGNYHPQIACSYTDYGFFSARKQLGEDVQKVFQQIAGMGKAEGMRQILQSPFSLHEGVLKLIEKEIIAAKKGKPATIYAKMNALIEPEVIGALYKASQAGVTIKLVVRGICSLKPGVKGLSENIEVRSIIGRFLEHSRVFYFANQGNHKVFLSSADWMERNFFRRVEIFFPIEDPELKKRIFEESFENYFNDNSQAWLLRKDGSYSLFKNEKKLHSAQETLLKKFTQQPT